jgi:hypothetical protein
MTNDTSVENMTNDNILQNIGTTNENETGNYEEIEEEDTDYEDIEDTDEEDTDYEDTDEEEDEIIDDKWNTLNKLLDSHLQIGEALLILLKQ